MAEGPKYHGGYSLSSGTEERLVSSNYRLETKLSILRYNINTDLETGKGDQTVWFCYTIISIRRRRKVRSKNLTTDLGGS